MTTDDPDAVFIKAKLKEADASTRKALEHYRDAGERLAKKREELGHRKWLTYLKANGIKQQRDSECRRLFEGWGKLPLGGTLSLKHALRIIRVAREAEGDGDEADAPVTKADRKKPNLPDLASSPRHYCFPKALADELDSILKRFQRRWKLKSVDLALLEMARRLDKQYQEVEVSRG